MTGILIRQKCRKNIMTISVFVDKNGNGNIKVYTVHTLPDAKMIIHFQYLHLGTIKMTYISTLDIQICL